MKAERFVVVMGFNLHKICKLNQEGKAIKLLTEMNQRKTNKGVKKTS